MTVKKKKAPNPIAFAKAVLRGASRKWYAGNEVLKRCRVSRGVYKCEGCGLHTKKQNLQIDHIEPVVDIKVGFQNLHDWVMRLYVTPEQLQALCHFENDDGSQHGCHPNKTFLENQMRDFYKAKKPTKKKK